MTVQEYCDHLKKLVQDHPECLNMKVVTSSDDEGNSFNLVFYTPSLGWYEDGEYEPTSDDRANVVCLN